MTIAEYIADDFALDLDINRLSPTQMLVLHAIRNVVMAQAARRTIEEWKRQEANQLSQ
jgi:hypothetical protein